eukprot:scaffold19940_cov124-Isochrysis_galbana.AAC.3
MKKAESSSRSFLSTGACSGAKARSGDSSTADSTRQKSPSTASRAWCRQWVSRTHRASAPRVGDRRCSSGARRARGSSGDGR